MRLVVLESLSKSYIMKLLLYEAYLAILDHGVPKLYVFDNHFITSKMLVVYHMTEHHSIDK